MDDEVYVGSEGDAEGHSDDQIVTDELLDVDDAYAGTDYSAADADTAAEEGNATVDEGVKGDDGQPAAADADSVQKAPRKRSRSRSPPASREKDDFDDDELDSDVDETGRLEELLIGTHMAEVVNFISLFKMRWKSSFFLVSFSMT